MSLRWEGEIQKNPFCRICEWVYCAWAAVLLSILNVSCDLTVLKILNKIPIHVVWNLLFCMKFRINTWLQSSTMKLLNLIISLYSWLIECNKILQIKKKKGRKKNEGYGWLIPNKMIFFSIDFFTEKLFTHFKDFLLKCFS